MNRSHGTGRVLHISGKGCRIGSDNPCSRHLSCGPQTLDGFVPLLLGYQESGLLHVVKWHLGFPSYLIADGAYPELSVGQDIDCFALEFHPRSLMVVSPRPKETRLVLGCDYSVVAQILYVSDKACLIDFGLRAACSLPGRDVPKRAKVGGHVQGFIYVGIPLCIPQIPEHFKPTMKYKWHIGGISANVTPLVESKSVFWAKQKTQEYDKSRMAFKEVDSTNAGAMDYVLHCDFIAEPPHG
jgi:hypothetical protein